MEAIFVLDDRFTTILKYTNTVQGAISRGYTEAGLRFTVFWRLFLTYITHHLLSYTNFSCP